MYLLKKIKTINTKGFTMSNLTRKEQCKIICKHLKHDGDELDETVMISSVWDALKEIESKTNNNNKNIELINDYLDLLNGKEAYVIDTIKTNIFRVIDKKYGDKYYFKIDENNHILEGKNSYDFNSNCINNLKGYYKMYEKMGMNNTIVKDKLLKLVVLKRNGFIVEQIKLLKTI